MMLSSVVQALCDTRLERRSRGNEAPMHDEMDLLAYLPHSLTTLPHSAQPPAVHFVTADNVEQGRTYANRCLADAGLPSPLTLWQPSAEDVVKTLNCVFMLLQQRQRDMQVCDTPDAAQTCQCRRVSGRFVSRLERTKPTRFRSAAAKRLYCSQRSSGSKTSYWRQRCATRACAFALLARGIPFEQQ